ncbi:MAG: peptide deformylase [Bacteroidales bacterium]|nr:peptide deformylase [Bacteroidales bacterium]
MILPIYLYGSPVLRKEASLIDIQTAEKEKIAALFKDMYETMKHADGCGIAAPQVGKSLRMLIVDGSDFEDKFPELKEFYREMINPEFVEKSEETSTYSEGCLSLPNLDADIVRPKKIVVKYFDKDFQEHTETFDDFASRMVQHEMDHLDGTVFTDHASPIRRKMLEGKLRGISKGCVRTHYKVKLEK